ncbi:hypothetical protein Leryth_008899, partial [Lithospermum erythrorhizon]
TEVVERNNVDVVKLETKRGKEGGVVYAKNPLAKLTLLYSHGNAADLGQMVDLFSELSIHLRLNIMGYGLCIWCLDFEYVVVLSILMCYTTSI